MKALDQRRTDDNPAHHVALRRDVEESRVKLQALAEALNAVGLRSRETNRGDERVSVLRVWDPERQTRSETIAALRLAEGWRFACHPDGPVLADADGIAEPGDAHAAARVIAAHIAEVRKAPPDRAS